MSFEPITNGEPPVKSQVCNRCGVEKLLVEFSTKKDGKNGRNAVCKVCRAEKARIRYIPKSQRDCGDDFIRRIWIDAAKEILMEKI